MKRIKPKSILRIDHMSDLLKISFILLGIAIYYDNQIVWTLTFITSSSYLFYTILNHDLSNYKKLYIKIRASLLPAPDITATAAPFQV